MDIYYVCIYTVLSLFIKKAQSQYPYYQNQVRSYNYNEMSPMETIYEDYEDYGECSCSCQTCEGTKPCCREYCANCFQQSPSSIVIVPYPYPFIISTKQKEATTQAPTTEQTTPVTTQEPTTEYQKTTVVTEFPVTLRRSNDAYFRDIIAKAPRMNDKNKFVLTSLRRTKSNMMPKYGIVPIPDNLAEKLMLQLRSMRVLHSKKETLKTKDIVSTLERR